MIEGDISTAIMQGIAAGVEIAMPGIPVQYPGVTFQPPLTTDDAYGGSWVEAMQVPNNQSDQTYDTGRTYQGVIRLMLHVPKAAGLPALMRSMDTLAIQFPKGTRFWTSGGSFVLLYVNPVASNVGVDKDGSNLLLLTMLYRCSVAV